MDPGEPGALLEAQEVLRVEEELCDGEVRAQALLGEQDIEVLVGAGRFRVTARVARDAHGEPAGCKACELLSLTLANEADEGIGMREMVRRERSFPLWQIPA